MLLYSLPAKVFVTVAVITAAATIPNSIEKRPIKRVNILRGTISPYLVKSWLITLPGLTILDCE